MTIAGAERMVAAVFSAISDTLARNEPVSIAGFGKFVLRSRAARQGRNPAAGEPVAIAALRAPSFKAAKPCATQPTDSMDGEVVWTPPLVPSAAPGHEQAFVRQARRCVPPRTFPLPVRLLRPDRRTRAPRIASVSHCPHAAHWRAVVDTVSPGSGTFGAGRRRADFRDSSDVRTPAQSRAELESPRARVSYMAGGKILFSTVLRAVARYNYCTCYPFAYCHVRPTTRAPHLYVERDVPGTMYRSTGNPGLPPTVMTLADTSNSLDETNSRLSKRNPQTHFRSTLRGSTSQTSSGGAVATPTHRPAYEDVRGANTECKCRQRDDSR